ncbi:IS110 family transposase [Solidesulfovibrio sp.]|uniref:IS110 family transposase n=1 Tax=Solidesulfovibrio sp. TaxID=2910990 RepID=UPI002B20347C|nr:IS110 family transposase [Solidesulfovibrio sp.]MEA5089599.1 IS110 family transposase [Solidesulfovibrio sp.]HML54556.1 IS110 family transposase [Solidesulfovibrio magneticus]
MRNVTTIGVDLAKNTFQLHGVDAHGKVMLRRTLRRNQVVPFFANLPSCLVGMEACASSAYWARAIEECGHTVRRIHPRFVKPYLMADKNDANDAAAICEAVARPRMRFVPHKTQEQADIQAIHRVRKVLVQARTAAINQARGLLAENGLVLRQGACHVRSHLPAMVDDLDNGLSGMMRRLLASIHEYITILDARIAEQDKVLAGIAKEHEACKRLMKIPGVGVLTATILLTMAGAAKDFKNGREFAAYLGLVPRQYSSGGKQRLLGITKRGDSYARTLLIHGARAVLRAMHVGRVPLGEGASDWLARLVDRRGHNRGAVALANKTARIVWNMLSQGTEYRMAA